MKQKYKTLNKIVDFFIPMKEVDKYGFTYVGFKQAYDTITMALAGIILLTYITNATRDKDWSLSNYCNSVKGVAERTYDMIKTGEIPLKKDNIKK